ncbi:MAG: pyridoxal-dependent decarboxylase [Pseudomonadota bacterium]
MRKLLRHTAELAEDYLQSITQRDVFPKQEAIDHLVKLEEPLPLDGEQPETVIQNLHTIGGAATVATTGSRYFGFVTGGSLPATLASSWLTSTWDQNAHLVTGSPTAAAIEQIAANWLVEGLDLPRDSAVGFVTGATMANFCGLAAARLALLTSMGWNLEERGLFGAPNIPVYVSEEVHVSVTKALALLGFGVGSLCRMPVDDQGRVDASRLSKIDSPSLVCLQSGNVNTGAFDPISDIHELTKDSGSWLHVDGAFGLWARFCSELSTQSAGIEMADSWATDAHKWLNVPYDCGLVFCKEPKFLASAMRADAAYLDFQNQRDPSTYTPELSRRARGIDTYVALKTLGKSGVSDLINRCCALAKRFARSLENAGFTVLNDVVLNQVLVTHPKPEKTPAWILAIQQDGTCWCGQTHWQGYDAIRISVSSWRTTESNCYTNSN